MAFVRWWWFRKAEQGIFTLTTPLHSPLLFSSNPASRIPINSSNLSIHLPVCSCSFNSPLLSFANNTVAVPALWPAVISSRESPTCLFIKPYFLPHVSHVRHTMIKPSPPSSSSHALAMCKIPAGSGFGGLNSLVTIGAKVLPGRNVCKRCVTGPLYEP